jgi:hypothetical protein
MDIVEPLSRCRNQRLIQHLYHCWIGRLVFLGHHHSYVSRFEQQDIRSESQPHHVGHSRNSWNRFEK